MRFIVPLAVLVATIIMIATAPGEESLQQAAAQEEIKAPAADARKKAGADAVAAFEAGGMLNRLEVVVF
ncbi:hypothetical protein [Paraflavitalea sp. CAU 1676]|uniref:hypothetical protein n=1 Tax=Paraflavitalea sp. CAU 1676 TaxID=3032598 RepID=UPI0023DA22D5|nr:hypothetical protein [Paraflavitalea sp. CAU 1676]MDF2189414.1 hypothetical protein [Paraflavitalea sp. CAU 1676]